MDNTEVLNPFSFGNPLMEPEKFFGRDQEIRQISNRLLSNARESTSIVGERRIGKTSLAYYLTHPRMAEQIGLTPDRYCLVYIDFQGMTDITPQRFWQRVIGKIGQSLFSERLVSSAKALLELKEIDFFDLEDLFHAFKEQGLTIGLILDEFEYITQNPNFTTPFFSGLRSLAIHSNLVLLAITRSDLVDLCYSDEIKSSPFFNIFASVVLYPFSKPEVNGLLDRYLEGTGISFSEQDRELVWSLSGGHPFFVQMAGYYLFEAKRKKLVQDSLRKEVYTHFAEQAEAHFSYYWSHSNDREKISLLILLGLSKQKTTKSNRPTIENIERFNYRARQDIYTLKKRGLIVEREGEFHIFSTAFGDWMMVEVLSTTENAETPKTVEEWIKKEGQESLRGAKTILPLFKKKYWPIFGALAKDIAFEFAAQGAFEIFRSIIR